MKPSLLQALSQALDDAELQALIQAHQLDIQAVEALRTHSAGFYYSQPSEALQIAEHFGCKTVDLTDKSIMLQVVGDPDKIDALMGMLQKFKIIEIVRTGKVLMARGSETT